MELWRKWSGVYADLQELRKTNVLNHEPTIAAVGDMLPSNASKDSYINLECEGWGREKMSCKS